MGSETAVIHPPHILRDIDIHKVGIITHIIFKDWLELHISIYQFLDSSADCITTDQVILAERVQRTLDKRPDRMVLEDRLYDFWKQFM